MQELTKYTVIVHRLLCADDNRSRLTKLHHFQLHSTRVDSRAFTRLKIKVRSKSSIISFSMLTIKSGIFYSQIIITRDLGVFEICPSSRPESGISAPTCPQVEGESSLHQIWGIALGAQSPDRSSVWAAGWSGRHQFEPESGGDCWPTGTEPEPHRRARWEAAIDEGEEAARAPTWKKGETGRRLKEKKIWILMCKENKNESIDKSTLKKY